MSRLQTGDIIKPSLTTDDFHNLLPCLVKPIENELFTSWIYRLAHNHNLKVQTFCKVLFANQNVWNRDIDKSVPDDIINILALKTGIGKSRALDTTLKSYENKLFDKINFYGTSRWIIPVGVYHRKRTRFGQQVCASCIKSDSIPYFRKYWRLSLVGLCSKCKCELIQECPKCKLPITFFRQDVGHKETLENLNIFICIHCNYDLRKSETVKVDKVTNELQYKLVTNIVKMENSVVSPNSVEFFNVLQNILTVICSKFKKSMPIQIYLDSLFGIEFTERIGGISHSFSNLKVKERIIRLNQALWLLDEWPKNFLEVNKATNTFSNIWLKDFPDAPIWFSKVLKEHLFGHKF